MATLVFAGIGGAVGGAIGGSFLGLSAAAIGQAVGGTLGKAIDNSLFGPPDQTQEYGQIDRLRIQTAGEGTAIPRAFGRVRVPGHTIWSSDFIEVENRQTSGGGSKLSPSPSVTTVTYEYYISLAIAVGEGEVSRIGRIWADGEEIDQTKLNITFYRGSEDQTADALIASYEGIENTPAFQGTSYVVIEELPLEQFGNRVPQLNFEVFRQPLAALRTEEIVQDKIRGVSLIPGSGEYIYATTPVRYEKDFAETSPANAHSLRGGSNIENSISDLRSDLPNCGSVSLVVSWFGNDLRCDRCNIQPKVEFQNNKTDQMPWMVNGISRENAAEVSLEDGSPIYGGTPTDQSIVEAIELIKAGDQGVFFYPFVLMDIPVDNGLDDPYAPGSDQAKLPWRGRITASVAPNQVGTTDKTNDVIAEIDAFFGQAAVSDFTVNGTEVSYNGPSELSYRRFILHYAHLCAAVGGVTAFSLGSEMRGLTTLRDANNSFPAVDHFKQLCEDVRSILGPDVKIGYAADWSEYFGYQPGDGSGDVYFHLDDLWAHPDIDFIGIDNYMPLSDWRDEPNHLDDAAPSIYDQSYLKSNIEGGEGFDWFYATQLDREIQNRTPITDGAYNQDWMYRYKDIRNWWENQHHNRPEGVQSAQPTAWVPRAKPIWFTELGFGAVNKATNQPNVFVDPKSSESALPHFSSGEHDAQIQLSAIRAVLDYWDDPQNNPRSDLYGDRMIDTNNVYVWAWDVRPWPDFPYRTDVWSDGGNYRLGHWVSGRTSSVDLSQIVAELSGLVDLQEIDPSILTRMVRGFLVSGPQTPRQGIEELMLAYDFSAVERDGILKFDFLDDKVQSAILTDDFVFDGSDGGVFEVQKASALDRLNSVSVSFWDADDGYEFSKQKAFSLDPATSREIGYQLPIVMERNDANILSYALLDKSLENIENIKFSLPPSKQLEIGDVFDVIDLTGPAKYRVLSEERGSYFEYEAERISQIQTEPLSLEYETGALSPKNSGGSVEAYFLDLPRFNTDESDDKIYVAATAAPWRGAAIYEQDVSGSLNLKASIENRSIIGRIETPIKPLSPSRISGYAFEVAISSGQLSSVSRLSLLSGANLMTVSHGNGDWELVQFQSAELQPSGKYILSGLLRGQGGTEFLANETVPIGATIAILYPSLGYFEIFNEVVNVPTQYKFGPLPDLPSDPTFVDQVFTPKLVSRRPYRPAHLEIDAAGADLTFKWTRRSRGGLDVWNVPEVPLNENAELYQVVIAVDGIDVRDEQVTDPVFGYSVAQQNSDGVTTHFEIKISQISADFGAGPALRRTIYV